MTDAAGAIDFYKAAGNSFVVAHPTLQLGANVIPTSLGVGNLHNQSGAKGQLADLVVIDGTAGPGHSQAYVYEGTDGGTGFKLVPNPAGTPGGGGGYALCQSHECCRRG